MVKKCKRCSETDPDLFYKTHTVYCKECAKAKSREWHTQNKDKPGFKEQRKDQELRWRYGISLQERQELLKLQSYMCDICFNEIDESAHTDHNHKTGKVRGLLCSNCNRALGHFQEDKDILLNAIRYLERHS